MTTFWCELAWLGDPVPAGDVVIECGGDGRIASVTPGRPAPDDATVLPGLTLPGLANAHSHCFQRALRGRTQAATAGSFWTWRDQMYALAESLDEARYAALARATFAEMAQAGITLVGEFDYIHHSEATIDAARAAGIRLTLIDACYLEGGLPRFRDADVGAWMARLDRLAPDDTARLAAAIHSVRAVDPVSAERIAGYAREREWPLHAHVSEQPRENEECHERWGGTPLEVLERAGALSPRFTAVHATHLSPHDVELIRDHGVYTCLCPTTERDLADGIGDAPGRLTLGSDSNAVIDLFEEARAVELDTRLATLVRGTFAANELLAGATLNGYASLGWRDGGALDPGALADMVSVRLDSVRLAGTRPDDALDAVVFAGGAPDVDTLVVGGEVVVRDGAHVRIDVAGELARAIAAVS